MDCQLSTGLLKKARLFCGFQHQKGRDAFLSGRKHLDFLDILLTAQDENGNGLTFQEIRDEVDTFLFAGDKNIVAYQCCS